MPLRKSSRFVCRNCGGEHDTAGERDLCCPPEPPSLAPTVRSLRRQVAALESLVQSLVFVRDPDTAFHICKNCKLPYPEHDHNHPSGKVICRR